MALRSMTGFGRATVSDPEGGGTWAVEARSVNHRFLDVKLRLPPLLVDAESTLRAAVSQRLRRGRIELVVLSPHGDEAPAGLGVSVNFALAGRLVEAHRALADRLGVPVAVTTAELAAYPGVLLPGEDAATAEALRARLLVGVEAALDALVRARHDEGQALAAELSRRLDAVQALKAQIAHRAPEQAVAYRTRLEARMRELLGALDLTADPGRVLHEVAVFAEKTDVTEELARLEIHLGQAALFVRGEGADDEGIGRRFDFVCQEMNREANTIGSKVQDVQISSLVIEVKAELERLREQVQNVE
jgi:uncharacterized protein (TIGR00255 family)